MYAKSYSAWFLKSIFIAYNIELNELKSDIDRTALNPT